MDLKLIVSFRKNFRTFFDTMCYSLDVSNSRLETMAASSVSFATYYALDFRMDAVSTKSLFSSKPINSPSQWHTRVMILLFPSPISFLPLFTPTFLLKCFQNSGFCLLVTHCLWPGPSVWPQNWNYSLELGGVTGGYTNEDCCRLHFETTSNQ